MLIVTGRPGRRQVELRRRACKHAGCEQIADAGHLPNPCISRTCVESVEILRRILTVRTPTIVEGQAVREAPRVLRIEAEFSLAVANHRLYIAVFPGLVVEYYAPVYSGHPPGNTAMYSRWFAT